MPEAIRTQVIERYHNAPAAGYEGSRKIEKRIGRHYY
jgi:hypothetical protein